MSDRFVVGEIRGYRIAASVETSEIAVHDSWYCYRVVANYPRPAKRRAASRETAHARTRAGRANESRLRMSGLAERCDGCATITYDRRPVSLLVDGNLRAERDLCAACRTNAIDGFLMARDGMVMRRVDWHPASQ